MAAGAGEIGFLGPERRSCLQAPCPTGCGGAAGTEKAAGCLQFLALVAAANSLTSVGSF